MGSPDKISAHSVKRILKELEKKRQRRQKENYTEFVLPTVGNAVGTVASIRPDSITIYHDGSFISVASKKHHDLAIGDHVSFPFDSPHLFNGPLKRKGVIARVHGDWSRRNLNSLSKQVIAANVDIALIVTSAANPPFHPRFVDRYLVINQIGRVRSALILNKSDLTSKRHPYLDAYLKIGLPIIETSAIHNKGIDKIRELIRFKTAVLVGNSGVGKSALINALIPSAEVKTNEISTHTNKGQHTTTSSNLFEWEKGSFIIDTPGIRSLGLNGISKQDLAAYFPEFAPYINDCHFANCTHSHEPECGVRQAVEKGHINELRYDSYLRLLKES